MSEQERVRRKRKVINIGIKSRLQLKYLCLVIGTIIALMILVGISFYTTFSLVIDTAQLGAYADTQLTDMFAWVKRLLLGEFIVIAFIAGYISMRLSHRIAGPLYRIENIIQNIIDGKLTEIKIRKNDELQDLVEKLNKLVEIIGKEKK